ncbi:hypothetical protein LDENG_00176910 [Lucifuga dentata]|nr:hypothetical protein LDENG_00176910 [Lucifuga dentata]
MSDLLKVSWAWHHARDGPLIGKVGNRVCVRCRRSRGASWTRESINKACRFNAHRTGTGLIDGERPAAAFSPLKIVRQ